MNPIIITCYSDPDLDGFACSLAYEEFLNKTGQNVKVKISGDLRPEAEFLAAKFGIKYPKDFDLKKDDKIILVDSSELKGIDFEIDPENVIEVIDHRKFNEAHLFKNAKIQIEQVGAAATLIAEKFYNSDFDISTESAALLYGAIISNTINFQNNIVTERDKKMGEWLSEKLKDVEFSIKEMFEAKSDLDGDKLGIVMNQEFAWFDINNKKVSIVQLEIINAEKLIKKRKTEIISELEKLKDKHNLDFIFLSAIDIEKGFNIFVAPDKKVQDLLKELFGVDFSDSVATRGGIIMRKEIMPLLREKFKI